MKPVQKEVRNISEITTLASNAKKYLADFQKEFALADRARKIEMITNRNFRRLHHKHRKFSFIGNRDPISSRLPYWEQLRTIATDPKFAWGELVDREVAENGNQQGQYVPPLPETLQNMPTESLRACCRCGATQHTYYYAVSLKLLEDAIIVSMEVI